MKRKLKNLSKALLAVALCFLSAACGGQINRLPVDTTAPRRTPTPLPTPTPTPVTITADSVLNMDMVGQCWLFQNGYGETSTFCIEAVQPLNRTNADGTVTTITWTDPNRFAAGRDGNNLVIHMTKTVARTYWMIFVPEAEIWFLLHQNPDGSWRSTASLINLPHGCPWCGPNGQPTTDPMAFTIDVLDNQPGMPLPYLISPPTLRTGDYLINETRVCAVGRDGLTFDNIIPDGSLCGPMDGEYWRTDFSIDDSAMTMAQFGGPVAVSNQYEGQCGHELWRSHNGIVGIELPYDGGQIKNDPACVNYGLPNPVHDPNLNIFRTR